MGRPPGDPGEPSPNLDNKVASSGQLWSPDSASVLMVDRFFQIQTELSAVADLIPLIPTLVECDLLAKGFVHLKHFNQITVLLQEEGITFLRVREIFDTMLEEDYPELSGHLATDAEIVENVEFERAIVKIAKGLIEFRRATVASK